MKSQRNARGVVPTLSSEFNHIPLAEYTAMGMVSGMELVRIYECFCDRTRLRILHLLGQGPLCVCHLQAVLGAPQVKVSKHLAYLKSRGLVEASREANWMIYRLPGKPPRELTANLACLQDCAGEDPIFRRDAGKLRQVRQRLAKGDRPCGVRIAKAARPHLSIP